MDNLRHTKGKWNVRGNQIFIGDTSKSIATIHVVKNYKDVTFEPIEDVEAVANAKLIASAPELLDALLSCWGDFCNGNIGNTPSTETRQKVRTAIQNSTINTRTA
jgi:hypothetical protein